MYVKSCRKCTADQSRVPKSSRVSQYTGFIDKMLGVPDAQEDDAGGPALLLHSSIYLLPF